MNEKWPVFQSKFPSFFPSFWADFQGVRGLKKAKFSCFIADLLTNIFQNFFSKKSFFVLLSICINLEIALFGARNLTFNEINGTE